ncbi:MAG: hypothetical protein ACLPL5_12250 [Stellaceae bacterium]
MADIKQKTAKALRAEYEAIARQCTEIAEAVKKKGPELQKEIEAKLSGMGLNLAAAVARKRAAFTAWEKARDAEKANPPAASPEKARDAEQANPPAASPETAGSAGAA